MMTDRQTASEVVEDVASAFEQRNVELSHSNFAHSGASLSSDAKKMTLSPVSGLRTFCGDMYN